MTYSEAKKIVAEKHKLGKTLVTGHASKYFDEAADLYGRSLLVSKERSEITYEQDGKL